METFDFSVCYGGALISGAESPSYPAVLRLLYSVNDSLKADGIMAPSDDSLVHTRRLYELISRPLDQIPTVHVGGTNGKVGTFLYVIPLKNPNLFLLSHMDTLHNIFLTGASREAPLSKFLNVCQRLG